MSAALPRHAYRLLARVMALALAGACLLSAASAAHGGQSPVPGGVGAKSAGGRGGQGPTILREIEASRTATSKTHLMSDGTFSADFYTQPIHYRDSSRRWRDIDPTLVQTPEYGVSEVRASDYDIEIASEDVTGTPVSVTHDGWTFGMELVGGEQSAVMTLGDRAVYPLAMTDTSLVYETGGNAVKDTLVLASKNAPDTFTFHMKLDGLSLCQSVDGPGYTLLDAKGARAGRISPLTVFDSAVDAAGEPKAVCASASVSVAPADGGVNVTYHVPRQWLDDPARVYPVKVDPDVAFYSGTAETCDTYYSKASGGGSYTTYNHLDVGKFSTSDRRRALLSFEMASLPRGILIDSAKLQMYCYSNTSGGNSTTNLYGVDNNWHGGSHYTWDNTFRNSYLRWNSLGDGMSARWAGTGYVDFYPTSIVQSWYNGGNRNYTYGFLLMAKDEDVSPAKCFWSSRYSTQTARQPHLTVNYTKPWTSGALSAASFGPGDAVTATVRLWTKDKAPNDCVSAQVIGKDSKNSDVSCGLFRWRDDQGFYTVPEYGDESKVALVENACSVADDASGRTVRFVYRIAEGYGDVQSNRLLARASGWTSTDYYADTGAVFAVLPASASPSAVTTASAGWWSEAAGPGDSATAGRGSVGLSWPPAASATVYKINLFDGNSWREVGSTASTNWTSAGKGLYPPDSAISSLATGTAANPFLPGAGLDLRDDPRALYAKTAGTAWDSMPAYAFKVVPCNRAGSAPISEAVTVTVSLDNRTRRLAETPKHTEAELDDIAGEGASALLDKGALALSAGDLDIKTFGPAASLSREYDSSDSFAGLLGAPGWRFGFERRLSVDATGATYTDASGDEYRFRLAGGVYVPPAGMVAALAADTSVNGSVRSIRFKDRSKLYFDGQGRFVGESDNNNQKTLVHWNVSDVTIEAANGQSIVVSTSGGRATSAQYSTDDGARHVDYSWSPGAGKATVSYSYSGENASWTATRSVEYTYASGKITGVTLLTAEHFAHLTGNAQWAITYSGGRLASVSAPTLDGTNPALTTISAPMADGSLTSATLTRTGKVNGSDAGITEIFTWNPDGSMAAQTNPKTASEGVAAWSYTYDVNGEQASETDPLNHTTRSVFDSRGNEIYEIDALGFTTANTYDADDDLVSSVDPVGCVITNHYDDAGNLDWTEKLLNAAGEKARTEYGYNTDGRKSFERQVLCARDVTTHWLHTAFDYAGSTTDEPASVTKKGQTQSSSQKQNGLFSDEPVSLGASDASKTASIVTSSEYDAFGNETKATDALGNFKTSVFDLEGRVLESTDESRTLAAKHRYDALGHETHSWQEAGGVAVGYTETDFDVLGHAVAERAYTTNGGISTRQLYKTLTRTRDAMGREIASDDSMVNGADGHALLDARGNVLKTWVEGLPTAKANDDVYATVSVYDALDLVRSVREPSAQRAETSVYDAEGQETNQTAADGTISRSRYDGAGNVIEESEESTSGVMTATRTSYDLGGRAVATYDEEGDPTTSTFDPAGRQVAAQGPDTPASPILYNAVGWTISKTDADGIATVSTYDAKGQLLFESVGSGSDTKTSASSYDATGRTLTETDKDAKRVASVYDAFGRVIDQAQSKPSGLIKRLSSTYDSLSRAVATTETPSGVSVRTTYPTAYEPGGSTAVATTYGGITTTLTVDSAGNELARASAAAGASFTRSVESTDAAGRITKWNLGASSTWASRAYDDMGRVASQNGSAFTSAGVYGFGEQGGRKSSETLPLASAAGGSLGWIYGYTVDGRLATATPAGRAPEMFTHDEGGRIRAYSVSTNRAGAALSGSLDYDLASSRLTQRMDGLGFVVERYGFDGQGNRSSQKRTLESSVTMSYDGQNRLETYRNPNASVAATYTYDATGQRTRSLVGGSPASTETAWTYQGLSLLSLASTRTAGSTTSTWTITYLYDAEDQPYAGVYRANGAVTPFCLVTTAHGDVVALTDLGGNAFASYRYDAFGRDLGVLSPGGGSVSAALAGEIASCQPLRYASYVYDTESAFYYLSARHYDPATFQFLQKDPAKADGEESAYQYCGGDPVGATDPSGLRETGNTPEEDKKIRKHRQKQAQQRAKQNRKKSRGHYHSSGGSGGGHSGGHFNRYAKPAPRLHGATMENMITMCKSQLGYREGPNNDTKYGEWFGSNHAYWCDMFISWCASKIGAGKIVHKDEDANTASHARWFYKKEQWGSKPRRGAIVFFDFGNPHWGGRWKGIHHVGIVEWVSTKNRVRTIEGNTGNGTVARRRRHASDIAGYGYPKYR